LLLLFPVIRDGIGSAESAAVHPHRLPAIDDRLDNIRRQKCQSQNTRHIGVIDAFLLGNGADHQSTFLLQALPPVLGFDDEPDEREIVRRTKQAAIALDHPKHSPRAGQASTCLQGEDILVGWIGNNLERSAQRSPIDMDGQACLADDNLSDQQPHKRAMMIDSSGAEVGGQLLTSRNCALSYDRAHRFIAFGAIRASWPWSGHYSINPSLWGYAHYGQFSEVGWQYLNGGSGDLAGVGTYVTLKSPRSDYSIIVETKDARNRQRVRFTVGRGLSTKSLAVWRSDRSAQFVRQADVAVRGGEFTLTLDPDSVYSITTTRGQRKGSLGSVPAQTAFPFPYGETFDRYVQPAQ
jgi:hypothetical protein